MTTRLILEVVLHMCIHPVEVQLHISRGDGRESEGERPTCCDHTLHMTSHNAREERVRVYGASAAKRTHGPCLNDTNYDGIYDACPYWQRAES